MSAPAFAWAMERGATLKLKPADRLVLLCLADMANGEKVCWPAQGRLVTFTGLAPNTVMVSLRRLADMQLIRVENRLGYASRYHVLRPDTPANGGDPSPANCVVVTPANGGDPSPQIVGTHPRNSTVPPPHDLRGPPPNRGDEPSKNQEKRTLSPRDAREGKQAKVKDSGEGGSKPAVPTPEPPKAPIIGGATPGGGLRYGPPKAEADPSDAPLPTPGQIEARRKAAAANLAALPGPLGGVLANLGRSLRTKPPPFTPSLAYQRSALEPIYPKLQPQDPIRTPEQMIAEAMGIPLAEAAALIASKQAVA